MNMKSLKSASMRRKFQRNRAAQSGAIENLENRLFLTAVSVGTTDYLPHLELAQIQPATSSAPVSYASRTSFESTLSSVTHINFSSAIVGAELSHDYSTSAGLTLSNVKFTGPVTAGGYFLSAVTPNYYAAYSGWTGNPDVLQGPGGSSIEGSSTGPGVLSVALPAATTGVGFDLYTLDGTTSKVSVTTSSGTTTFSVPASIKPALSFFGVTSATPITSVKVIAAADSNHGDFANLSNFTVGTVKIVTAVGNISGTVFNDVNKNGKLDTGETGLAGATVFLDLTHSGKFVNSDPVETTTSNGSYSFSKVPVGTAWVGTLPATGFSPGTAGAELSTTVATNATSTLNFAEVPTLALTPPINQIANAAVNTSYKLGSLAIGSTAKGPYKVTINWGDATSSVITVTAAGTLPASAHSYANVGIFTVTLTATDSASHTSKPVTFTATTLPDASISGTVYNDVNGDGLHTSNEPVLIGVGVELFNLDNKAAKPLTTTTSSTGAYSFQKLPAGDYRVVVASLLRTVAPTAGYYDLSGAAKLLNGKSVTGLNFELTNNVLIQGTVFVDLNGNGVLDTGEAIANDTITITNKATAKVVATLKTSSTGTFSTDALPAGTYIITAAPTAGDVFTAPLTGSITTSALGAASVNSYVFKEAKQKQSTNLNGSYSGTVDGNPATLAFSGQNATSIQGTLLIPALFNFKSSGAFVGNIDATGKFSYSRTNSNGTLTIAGQESVDGMTLTGTITIPVYGAVAFTFTRTA